MPIFARVHMKEKISTIRLKNGLKIILARRQSETCSIQVTVDVGSNQEDDSNRGVSHFIEHMLFEGTTNRDAHQIAREVEGIGSEIGAFTSNDRTGYYINCLRKHFSKGVEILSDIIRNPLFEGKMIDKEREVVLSEIRMRRDEPRLYQWQLFLSNLYTYHPAKHPIIGYSKIVNNLTSDDLRRHYNAYYVPGNMVITIVGNPPSLDPIKRFFGDMDFGSIKRSLARKEPATTASSSSIKRKTTQSYMIVGVKTVPMSHKDSIILEVIRAILGKGMSGRLFLEVRTKRGLAYDVGILHEAKSDYGFFAYYVSSQKEKLRLCRDIFFRELKRLDDLDERELQESKNFIEGERVMGLEENHALADDLGSWAIHDSLDAFHAFLERVNRVTKEDILAARDKYLTRGFVTTRILQD